MPIPYRATVSRPCFDPATCYGALGLKHAVDYFIDAGFLVDDYYAGDATRENIIKSLEEKDPILFFMVGHGSKSVTTCQNLEKLFWVCNCKELSGRVVYTLSCLCGKELGPDIIEKDGWCYIGYNYVFGWVQVKPGDPLDDRYARGFYEAVLEILYSLADGLTTGEAYKRSIDKWNYWIDYWSRQDDILASLVLAWMISDRDHQVLIGDENARVAIPVLPATLIPATLPLMIIGGVIAANEVGKITR